MLGIGGESGVTQGNDGIFDHASRRSICVDTFPIGERPAAFPSPHPLARPRTHIPPPTPPPPPPSGIEPARPSPALPCIPRGIDPPPSPPSGIDPAPFERAVDSPAVKDRIIDLQRRFDGKKVLLGIDRLDYVKV